jgi:hypothetical protein
MSALPTQNLEAETGVLGAIMQDNDVLHDVVPLLARRGGRLAVTMGGGPGSR